MQKIVLAAAVAFSLFACTKRNDAVVQKSAENFSDVKAAVATAPNQVSTTAYANWPEGFESGTKTAYAAGTVTLTTGSWTLTDALIGNSTSDAKAGTQSVRIQNTGSVAMNFNLTNGASSVTIKHALFGSDPAASWKLEYSTNSGSTWTQLGSNISTSSTTLSTATFSTSITGTVRFRVVKLTGTRINIDDFNVVDLVNNTTPTRDNNMAMGNPSGATTVTTNSNNYLMVKPQYALSYNNSRGICNWVSWHLSTAWKGTAARCDCFTSDATLPTGYFKATTSNYTNSGFDRGHMCPSEDRDGSSTDNAATFLMTNILPQAPNNNQQVWASLENYCRTLMNAGNELYIISGGYGNGGSGSLGGTTNTIASGSIAVPARVWKVIVVLPTGSNDVSRVSTSTRVICVNMPNTQSSNAQPWGYYRTSIDALESATGYDFLNNVPTNIQAVIEAAIDNGPTQ